MHLTHLTWPCSPPSLVNKVVSSHLRRPIQAPMELPTSRWTPVAAPTSFESSTFMQIPSRHLAVGDLGMENAQTGLLNFDSYLMDVS